MIPTCQRSKVLACTLDSLLQQRVLPAELFVVDASADDETLQVVEGFVQKTQVFRMYGG
ncbi:glycosyltransferase family A protein [Prosthecobacter sp.]|uniref:glycosyltransferase family A protein n=1 Tax=Prosthecobacter sp. TaxID=1965333 RepID=UPI001D8778DB|nr:glycosyltransferase family A protein [Prosthecobacter sp.]MCB1276980.1 glycosyltransferase [Prosthecobacter sp.]